MVDPQQLVTLAAAGDNEYRRAVAEWLLHPTEAGDDLFLHPSLLRRTRVTLGELLILADQRDTRRHDPDTRARWRAIRTAARAQRERIAALPPSDAGPRRRALHRLGQEYPAELEELRVAAAAAGKPRNIRRALLEQLAARHPTRIVALVREERERGEG